MANIPSFARDPEGYLRAINEPIQQESQRERAPRFRKVVRGLGYAAGTAVLLGTAGLVVTGYASPTKETSATGAEICAPMDNMAFPYAVPANIAAELTNGDAHKQAVGWSALERAMAVPSDGSIGEITFTVDGSGAVVATDTARLNSLIAKEKTINGVLGTASPDPNATASTPTALNVMSAEYCAPGELA